MGGEDNASAGALHFLAERIKALGGKPVQNLIETGNALTALMKAPRAVFEGVIAKIAGGRHQVVYGGVPRLERQKQFRGKPRHGIDMRVIGGAFLMPLQRGEQIGSILCAFLGQSVLLLQACRRSAA